MLAETFGALSPRKPIAPPEGQRVAFARHGTTPQLAYHGGEKGQAAAMMAWPTSAGLGAPRDQRPLPATAGIFNHRLFDRLRAATRARARTMVESQTPTGH